MKTQRRKPGMGGKQLEPRVRVPEPQWVVIRGVKTLQPLAAHQWWKWMSAIKG